MSQDKVRPLYAQLQGFLSQTPLAETKRLIEAKAVWDLYNETVALLEKETGTDYTRFKIMPQRGRSIPEYIDTLEYRQKLNGLINSLHAEYFANERPPFSGGPDTVVTQTQQQAQSQIFQVMLDLHSMIDKNIDKYPEGTEERGFLEKVKSSISTVSDVAGLFKLILETAKACGLNIAALKKLLSAIGLF